MKSGCQTNRQPPGSETCCCLVALAAGEEQQSSCEGQLHPLLQAERIRPLPVKPCPGSFLTQYSSWVRSSLLTLAYFPCSLRLMNTYLDLSYVHFCLITIALHQAIS